MWQGERVEWRGPWFNKLTTSVGLEPAHPERGDGP